MNSISDGDSGSSAKYPSTVASTSLIDLNCVQTKNPFRFWKIWKSVWAKFSESDECYNSSSNLLIFPLTKHTCGLVYCSEGKLFFSFAIQVWSPDFFIKLIKKIYVVFFSYCFSLLKIIKIIPSAFYKTMAMTFPVDAIDFACFAVEPSTPPSASNAVVDPRFSHSNQSRH